MSIEKFDRHNPSVSGETVPFVQIPRDVLQKISFPEAGFVWVYLLSLPKDWKVVKEHLKNKYHFGDKKIKQIFAYLNMCNLIKYHVQRCAKGRIIGRDIMVLIGNKFNDIGLSKKECTTGSNIHPVANHTDGFEALQIKQTTNKTKKQKRYCSSGDERALELFHVFWSLYPRKVGKKRAMAIWLRMKLHGLSEKINEDIKRRTADDPQWQEQQFVPHPSTYLNGERWEDEPAGRPVSRKSPPYQPPKKQETPFAPVTSQSTSWVSSEEALERDREYHRNRPKDEYSLPKGIDDYAKRMYEQRRNGHGDSLRGGNLQKDQATEAGL